MKYRLLISFLLLFVYVRGQTSFETGKIIDSIAVSNANNETFSLYLPTGFKSTELSPILIVFSPSGNGKQGVRVFKEAAENYNYILVCSNDAKNGPYDRNFGIAQRLFNHVFSNFNVKEKGVYLAGFSGGSRLVTAIASLSGQIEGVIACGAGFSQTPFHAPSTQKFSYAGICGERDMNYQEMLGVKAYLNRLQFDNTLFTFDGKHEWPPPDQIDMAFDWLEMESVKNGHLKRSKIEIEESYQKSYDFAKRVDPYKRPLVAHERHERLFATYSRFFKLDSIATQAKKIKQSGSFTKEFKARSKAFEREHELAQTFITRFNEDYEKVGKANMKWWDKEFKKLDRLVDGSTNRQTDKMLSRFRFKLYAMVYEKQKHRGKPPTPEQKKFCKAIYAKIYPKGFVN